MFCTGLVRFFRALGKPPPYPRCVSGAGGSLETAWLDAGWRLEALRDHPPAGLGDAYLFAIAGVDRQFANGEAPTPAGMRD